MSIGMEPVYAYMFGPSSYAASMYPLVPTLAELLAGWINRQQDVIIKCLREENRVLRQQLGGRVTFNDDHLERNQLIDGKPSAKPARRVECHERLGGVLRFYRAAA